MKFLFSFVVVFCTFGLIVCLTYICFQLKIIADEKERLKSASAVRSTPKETTENFVYENNSDSITLEV